MTSARTDTCDHSDCSLSSCRPEPADAVDGEVQSSGLSSSSRPKRLAPDAGNKPSSKEALAVPQPQAKSQEGAPPTHPAPIVNLTVPSG